MFLAFARALGDGSRSHLEVRNAAVTWMRDNPLEFVTAMTDEEWDMGEYIEKMSQVGTWGDNYMLQALCAVYKVYVQVYKVEGVTRSWNEAGDCDNHDSAFFLFLKDSHYENMLVTCQVSTMML